MSPVVVAQGNPTPAATTGALPSVSPVVFNGDVRQLPQVGGAVNPHHWNENDEPTLIAQPPLAGNRRTLDEGPNIATAAMPAPLQNFPGLSFSDNITGGRAGAGYPPDTNGDVGPNHYIQAVNDAFAIYDKSGTQLAAFTENSLWLGANSGTACDANNFGDPVVVYDALADRWILTNFAFANTTSGPFYECIAVSKSGDPVVGGWYLYAIRMDAGGSGPPSGDLADYPKFGIWTDCLYMAANEFKGNSFAGASFASFERSSLYAGATLNTTNSSIGFLADTHKNPAPFTMLPSNLLGTSSGSLPPSGRPNYYIAESLSGAAFEVRAFTAGQGGGHSCGTGGTLSTATLVPHATYTDLSGGDIVPQKNTSILLDSLYFRLMQKAQYRKIGSAESVWVVHSVRNTGQNVAPQWAQLDVSGGTIAPSVVQQQLYQPDTTLYRWMGSLAVDAQGNMALGYSTSSGNDFPGIAYSGRLAGDPLNNLSQTETQLVAGADSQTNNCGNAPCHRWGDYSSMSIDPADDCTFWYTSQYFSAAGNGSAGNWNTRIGSLKFPGCGNGKQSQTISFGSSVPAGAVFGGPAYTVMATATSGLAVTLSIAAGSTSVCALDGSVSGSHVSFIGVGTCTINANQGGNGNYNPAPQMQQSFGVGKATQTISFDSTAPLGASAGGTTYQVLASATSGLAVGLAIDASATSVCQLDGSISGSHVSFIGVGSCKINATQAGNANYLAAPGLQQSFTVVPGPPALLVFTTQPAAVSAGNTLATIAVTMEDALGDVIDDNASMVNFTISACGGDIAIGSATMAHGVATLDSLQRFYTVTDPATLTVKAQTGALTGNSAGFIVQANGDLVFADAFDGCRL